MSQRSFFLVAVLLLLLVSGIAATLIVLVRQEPAWYAAAALPPGPQRKGDSIAFTTEFFAMCNSLKNNENDPYFAVTDVQCNSFFEEDFLSMRFDRELAPDNFSQPRVAFDQDRIRLAFRYGHGLWSSIVSIDLRVWVPKSEPNVVALELEGFHAGALPISSQSLLEEVAEIGRKNGIDVNWYRHQKNPVALLRFQPDLQRPTFQIRAVQVKDHSIVIQWHMLDSSNVRPPESTPKAATP